MTGRERFLTALSNKKPDRLPFQVHSWMKYYLDTYLNGMDQFEAYDYLGMDPVIYDFPKLIFSEDSLKNWKAQRKYFDKDKDGVTPFTDTWETPKGTLTSRGAVNCYTSWDIEHMIKTEDDFELFREFYPVPVSADWSALIEAKNKIKDRGIVRTWLGSYGQPGSWQSLCYLMGTENAIMSVFDKPDWVHYALDVITKKALAQIEGLGKIEADLIENGGGSASSTVISPSIHREFCLDYDKKIHKALKDKGVYVVYHLCGGLMPLLDIVSENGTDALETMTPKTMGGDCDFKAAAQRVGDKLCFIGGFDQNEGFEKGNKDYIKKAVREMFEAKPKGGFIISPSDHFFFGDPKNIREFVKACRECEY